MAFTTQWLETRLCFKLSELRTISISGLLEMIFTDHMIIPDLNLNPFDNRVFNFTMLTKSSDLKNSQRRNKSDS